MGLSAIPQFLNQHGGQIVRSMDLFRYLVVVRHGSRVSRVTTWLFAIGFIIFTSSRLALMTDPNETTTIREVAPTAADYEIEVPYLGVTFHDGAGTSYNSTYITASYDLRDIFSADDKNSTRVSLGTSPCKLPHQLSVGWCPKENATVMGTYGDPDYRFIQMSFKMCVNYTEEGEPCAPESVIRDLFAQGGLSIDIWSFRSLGWSSWETLYLSIHPKIIQRVEIFLSPVTVREVAQYPWQSDIKHKRITRDSYYTRFSESVDSSVLLIAFLRISPKSYNDTIRRFTLIEMLTQVAAVWTVSVSGFGALLLLYNFFHWRKWYAGRYPWQVQYHYLRNPPEGAPTVVKPIAGLARDKKSWSWMRRPSWKLEEAEIQTNPSFSTPHSENLLSNTAPYIPLKPDSTEINIDNMPIYPIDDYNTNNHYHTRPRSLTPPPAADRLSTTYL
eukprot:TRINITY_DN3358_c0_g6_i2.p1 TRINITY_DN3358_c0_g6~~TRINITY_DN3358_c0_g6_i2.p1  ORF type:complete len:459 (+),score=61.63 TRINITY_DN3358_c0_g6_i2:48-1379(+)